MAVIRLDKYLADAGLGTRSTVKNIIKQNRISINDVTVKKNDIKVDTEKDVISFDGKELAYNEFEYFMLNKPQGVVSATKDDKDKTVIELINESKRRDLFPVGRLDKDTEGLLIITNDGKLANNLLAPGEHVEKKYFAVIEGEVTESVIFKFAEGIDIGDDKLTKPAKLVIKSLIEKKRDVSSEDKDNASCMLSEVEIDITEGRYHQIKRMFEAVGMKVIFLKRLSMGKLMLDDGLKPGDYRKLTDEELDILKASCNN